MWKNVLIGTIWYLWETILLRWFNYLVNIFLYKIYTVLFSIFNFSNQKIFTWKKMWWIPLWREKCPAQVGRGSRQTLLFKVTVMCSLLKLLLVPTPTYLPQIFQNSWHYFPSIFSYTKFSHTWFNYFEFYLVIYLLKMIFMIWKKKSIRKSWKYRNGERPG